MKQPADLESVLCAAYEAQVRSYEAALSAVERMPARLDRGESTEVLVGHVLAALDAAAQTEAEIAPVKSAWQSGGSTPGPLLQQALDRVAALLEQLKDRVRTVGERATAQGDCLHSSCDSSVRVQLI